jgi:endonuclease/exonuclease/phosphatase family metal-dependent hydrolase
MRPWLTFVLLVTLGCASIPAKGRDNSIRVMSYNIEYGNNGLDSVAAVIRDQHPDVVGLQEVDVHWSARSNFVDQADLLAKKTGMQYRFARIYQLPNTDTSKPPREFGVALLSRYPIVAFTNHNITRLSTQDSTPTPTLMPGLLDATIDFHGRKFRVMNVHLDYRADPAVRGKQVSEMMTYIGSDTISTVLTGDFNASPDAAELAPLFAHLNDTAPHGAAPQFTFSSTKPEKKIDYVLTTDSFCPTKYQVPKVHASDHFPVVVDFRFDGVCRIHHETQ